MQALGERRRDDHRAAACNAALVAAAVYNVHRPKGKKPLTVDDFVKPETRVVDPEDLAEILTSWAEAHNRRGGFVS